MRATRLVQKLRAKGMCEQLVKVVESWLRRRRAKVAVGRHFSKEMALENMVFQGTVWGPTLWNNFFEDARAAVNKMGFIETVFADDLNAFKEFDTGEDNEQVLEHTKKCQDELHKWGEANQVVFEGSKESMHVLARRNAEGENFKVLGVNFDCQLLMRDAVHELVVEAGWKLRTLVRSGRYFTSRQLIGLYKAHLLSYLEYRTSAIYHAATSALAALDNVQSRFLRDAGVTEEEALLEFNLAPLPTRRDMAMLGVIHRASLGKGPQQFGAFFKPAEAKKEHPATRRQERRHSRQLQEWKGNLRNGSIQVYYGKQEC